MLYFTIKSCLQSQQDLIGKSLRHLLPIKYIWSRQQKMLVKIHNDKKETNHYTFDRWGWVDYLSLLVGLNTFGLSLGLLVTWSSYKDKKMIHVTKKYVYTKNAHVSLGCFLCKNITRKNFIRLKTFYIMERKTTLSLI